MRYEVVKWDILQSNGIWLLGMLWKIFHFFVSGYLRQQITRDKVANNKENTVEPSCKSIDQNVSYTQVDYHVLCKTAK